MSWTKKQIADRALASIGIADYEFEVSAEERIAAVNILDLMMAEWAGEGISFGYPIPDSPSGSDVDSDSNLPAKAINAVYLNLAILLAEEYGRPISGDKRNRANAAKGLLLGRALGEPPEQQVFGIPYGAGNLPYYAYYRSMIPLQEPPIDASSAQEMDDT